MAAAAAAGVLEGGADQLHLVPAAMVDGGAGMGLSVRFAGDLDGVDGSVAYVPVHPHDPNDPFTLSHARMHPDQ